MFKAINNWFNANLLSFNITYDNNVISTISDIKFLGIKIGNTLSWKSHINKIVQAHKELPPNMKLLNRLLRVFLFIRLVF